MREEVEAIVARYAATPAREFPALARSGEVDLGFVRLGARNHPNPAIRWRCLTLLDHLDGGDATPVYLDRLAHDPVPRVRRHALHALTCDRCSLSPRATDVVPAVAESAQHDPNAKVRRRAREILHRYLPDERAARVLARPDVGLDGAVAA